MAVLSYSFPSRVITIVYVIVIHIVIAAYSALWVLIIKFLAKVVLDKNTQNKMAIAVTNWNVYTPLQHILVGGDVTLSACTCLCSATVSLISVWICWSSTSTSEPAEVKQ